MSFFLASKLRDGEAKKRAEFGPKEETAIILFNCWNGENLDVRKRKHRFTKEKLDLFYKISINKLKA